MKVKAIDIHVNYQIMLLILVLLLSMVVWNIGTSNAATTLYVNGTSGNDSWNGESATYVGGDVGPKKTIANGTDTVEANGEVYVSEGTYNEQVEICKNMSLIGSGSDLTVMDGNNEHWLISTSFNANITVSIFGFTFQNGNGHLSGGAIYNGDGNTLTLENCTFINNTAEYNGGALYNENGTVTVKNCLFTNNTCTEEESGGAAIYSNEGNLTSTDCQFIHNYFLNGDGYGGAICCGDTNIYLYNNYFYNNVGTGGGAIALDTSTEETYYAIINNTNFIENLADNEGGGAIKILSSTYNVTISNCNFTSNEAFFGSAISTQGIVEINYCNFNNNDCGSHGTITSAGVLKVNNSSFTNNVAYRGGGICNTGSLIVLNTSFINNTAYLNNTEPDETSKGGAIFNAESADANITGCVFINNSVKNGVYGDGGTIYNTNGATLTANYNRILSNSLDAVSNDEEGGDVDVKYNWWGSNNPDFSTLISGNVTYSPWLYMNFTSSSVNVNQGDQVPLTASFNYLYDGTTVTQLDPNVGHIPNGTPVTFTTTLGEVGSKSVVKYTVNGITTAILRATQSGMAILAAGADDELQTMNITINGIPSPTPQPVNAATGKTITMQKTGAPLIPLILALLMMCGGLIRVRKE